MPHEAEMEGLLKTVRNALEASYRLGVAEGKREAEEMRLQVLQMFGAPKAAINEQARRVPKQKKTPKRAEKGAVPSAVEAVFQEGLTTKELQEAVAAKNPSISPKSVYNELARITSGYENRDGKWFRKQKTAEISSAPPVQTTAPASPLSTLTTPVAPAPATASPPVAAVVTPQPQPAASPAAPTAAVSVQSIAPSVPHAATAQAVPTAATAIAGAPANVTA